MIPVNFRKRTRRINSDVIKRKGARALSEEALYTEREARAVFPYFRKIEYAEPLGLSMI